MSFAEFETSRDRGEPISLVLFTYGSGPDDYYAYTDGERPFQFYHPERAATLTYMPQPMSVAEIESSGTLDKASLDVTMAQSAGIMDLFRLRPPSTVVTLVIRQGHVNDPDADFIVGWSGRVTGFEVDATTNEATLTNEPISTSMLRTMLRRHWQYGCPHVLYAVGDGLCNANKAFATTNQVILGASGGVLTLDPSWATDARRPKYQGGVVEWTDRDGRKEIRRIISCGADGTVVLGNELDGIQAGDTISLILACNHKTGLPTLGDGGDCLPLFNNIRNFGGQPWIPLQNPVGIKNNFY